MAIFFDDDWRNGTHTSKDAPIARVLEIKDKKNPSITHRILVGREESRTKCFASIALTYASLVKGHDGRNNPKFSGTWQRSADGTEWVSLTGGSVMLSGQGVPRGHHIGTYLFDEVVRWAKQWPNAQVMTIKLSETDADDENRDRRNDFYQQFGIRFQFNEGQKSGRSMPMLVAGLQSVEPRRWKRDIVEHGVYEFLRMRLDDANESATAIKRLESTQSDFRHACAKPFRWACRQFWKTHRYHVIGILFVAFVILISWAKL